MGKDRIILYTGDNEAEIKCGNKKKKLEIYKVYEISYPGCTINTTTNVWYSDTFPKTSEEVSTQLTENIEIPTITSSKLATISANFN